ncbi:MAG: photosystem P840 reaction-center cytochrome c-551 [Candidatus Latescibacteria bacterium]|nr:photosystem P840 reaction-center cytochrome c-551 [Candidatus Latescibacterota bacterium]
MKRRIGDVVMLILIVAGVVAAALAVVLTVSVTNAQQDTKNDPKYATMDKGPASIDVSKYPSDQQTNYKVFASRCAKCHTLARPINSSFALSDEWERYIKRMMRKPGSGITSEDGKKIFEFLKYDSQTRKKALYEKKLKEAESGKKGS